jgi:hypothetical protein
MSVSCPQKLGGSPRTPDDSANANRGLEKTAAGLVGGVEDLALLFGLAGSLQPSGVLHGDLEENRR